ncbi:hypothetical protein AAA602_27565 [Pseudomonas aeruginosa]
MSATEAAPSWLKEKDNEEWKWAASYLSSRWPSTLQSKPSLLADVDFSYLLKSIHALESEVEGVKLIERLKNAIRQRRYRLAKGGRKTCSFTLPRETKATLKSLAKSHAITETALIQRLIEGAAQATSEQKEAMYREAQAAKVIRNSRKLAQELDKVRIEETQKQLRHCLKQLALWEISVGGELVLPRPGPAGEAQATALTEQRMRVIREVIEASVAEHKILNPRSL